MTSSPPAGMPLEPDFMHIARSTLERIEQEARRRSTATPPPTQTGGLLLGGRINEQPDHYDVLIVAASDLETNPLAREELFGPDIAAAQQPLTAQRTRYPRMDYLGGWHSVELGSEGETPTPAEIVAAQNFLLQPEHNIPEVVHMLVSLQPDGEVNIRYFYMNREMARNDLAFSEFDSNRVYLVDDTDPLVANEQATPDAGATMVPGAVASGRMDEEFRRMVAQGYQVRLREGPADHQFAVQDTRLPGMTIYVVAPNDYPAVPPNVLAMQDGQRIDLDESAVMQRWSSSLEPVYLVDIVNDVVHYLLQAPVSPTLAAAPTPPGGQLPTDTYEQEESGVMARENWPLWIAGGAVALLLLVLVLGYIFLASGEIPVDYEAVWQQVDQVATQPSPGQAELQAAIDGLERIRVADPDGSEFARNSEVIPTLTRLYVLLGNYHMRQQPPNLDAAERSYNAALGLINNDPAALEGIQRVRDARAEIAASEALSASDAEIWAQVDAAENPFDRVRLIEGLQVRGVETDPAGVPTSTRLFQARMDLARQQLEQQDYSGARTTAEAARQIAPDDAARQEAANLLAQVYLAEGQRELQAGRLPAARSAFNSVLGLSPSPAPDLLNQAQQALAEIDAAQTSQNNQQRVETGWQSYDAAVARQDWNAAIAALDSITQITGPTPEVTDFPSPPYDPRTYNVAEIRAQVRLQEAERLQRAGNPPAAQAQYEAVINGSGRIEDSTRQAAVAGLERLNQARDLWNQVNTAQEAGNWQQMRDALLALGNLQGFGAAASNPRNGQSVADLLAFANAQLEQVGQAPTSAPPTEGAAEPQPSATSEAVPPTTAPEPPTATATSEAVPPTALPLDTATPEPPTATPEPPTATPEPPTATPEPPTATPEPPTATPTEESAPLQTYTFPSGLFSLDVPANWQSNDQSGAGQARVEFTAPGAEYSMLVAVEAAPEGATQADLATLAQDFVEQLFGGSPGFSVADSATPRPDGGISLPFSYTETTGSTIPGQVVARLDADKISYLVVLFQSGEEARTPERQQTINAMLDSYQVDPAVALP